MGAHVRKAVGGLLILPYLALYVIAAATLGAQLHASISPWLEMLYYAVAGVIWVFPLRPLFAWINRAR